MARAPRAKVVKPSSWKWLEGELTVDAAQARRVEGPHRTE
jgi:hypothetical protein